MIIEERQRIIEEELNSGYKSLRISPHSVTNGFGASNSSLLGRNNSSQTKRLNETVQHNGSPYLDSQAGNLNINEGDYSMYSKSKMTLQYNNSTLNKQPGPISFSKQFPKFITVGHNSRVIRQSVNDPMGRQTAAQSMASYASNPQHI